MVTEVGLKIFSGSRVMSVSARDLREIRAVGPPMTSPLLIQPSQFEIVGKKASGKCVKWVPCQCAAENLVLIEGKIVSIRFPHRYSRRCKLPSNSPGTSLNLFPISSSANSMVVLRNSLAGRADKCRL